MELLPNEQILFNKMKETIKKSCEKYGFLPLDTPVIEDAKILLAKAGGETEKQIYRFEKGDNDLSLRFDLTVPLAKYVASRCNELVFPFKRYQVGKVFRGERNQKGRYREFYQCDIDVIGDEVLSLKYDSEMPSIIYDIFKKLNFGDFVIRINNRKILSGFFESLNLKDKISDILRTIDKIDKIGIDEVRKELKELKLSDDQIEKTLKLINSKDIKDIKDLCNNETFNIGVSELESVIEDLELRNLNRDNFMVDFTIARGLDYYTGTVYETTLKDYPSLGSVCSGGRYDNLAEFYTDRKLPGVGISIGLTRLFYQLMEAKIINPSEKCTSDVIIVPMTDNYEYIYRVFNKLKSLDLKVNICFLDKGFKQKLRYAERLNNKFAIIIGDDEVEKNEVAVKNLKEFFQTSIPFDDLGNYNFK
jgi:histidyl-tRNA synthetase